MILLFICDVEAARHGSTFAFVATMSASNTSVVEQPKGSPAAVDHPVSTIVPKRMNRSRNIDDFADVSLSDIEVEDVTTMVDGRSVFRKVAATIKGEPPRRVTAKALRKICAVLKVSGYKNKSKDEMLLLIGQHKASMQSFAEVYKHQRGYDGGSECSAIRGPQCPFRLMNIMFKDADTRKKFLRLAKPRSKQEMEACRSLDVKFWIDVHTRFLDESDENAGRLQFQHFALDEFDCTVIDPSIVIPHSWQQLRAIFVDLKSRYETAQANFARSGTHGSEFWKFCNGQLDVLYLHRFVKSFPSLAEVMTAMVPEENDHIEGAGEESYPNTPASSRNSSRSDTTAKLMEMLNNSGMRTELAKRKLDYFRDSQQYRNAKKNRDDEKAKREKEAFYLNQYNQLCRDIRRLKAERRKESCEEEKTAMAEELELLEAAQARAKAILQDIISG